MLCRVLGSNLSPSIDDAKSFFETLGTILKERYLIPTHQEHLKVLSRRVVDVVRYLSLTNSPWSPDDLILWRGSQVSFLKGFMRYWKLQLECFWNPSSFLHVKYKGAYSVTAFSQHSDRWWSHFHGNFVFLSKDKCEAETRKVACSSLFLLWYKILVQMLLHQD